MINLKVIKKNIETAFMCHPILETFTKQYQRDVAIREYTRRRYIESHKPSNASDDAAHEAVMILKKVNFKSNFELIKKRAN